MLKASCPKIELHNGEVNRFQIFHGFEFDNDSVFNQKVQPMFPHYPETYEYFDTLYKKVSKIGFSTAKTAYRSAVNIKSEIINYGEKNSLQSFFNNHWEALDIIGRHAKNTGKKRKRGKRKRR